MAADISYPAFPVIPNDLAIAPYVPIYFFAIVSDRPNAFAASFANASTLPDMAPKVTSTTFCTSVKLLPRSIHDFPNATIAAMLSTDARIAPTRFQAFAILAVCRSIRFVTCAVLACTFSICSWYGFVYASMMTLSFSRVIPLPSVILTAFLFHILN